ncbi:MAG: VOC family protein [Hyphomicrobiaceae bacterium]
MSSLDMHDNWIDAQVPDDDQIFIDHTGHFVADLEATAIALRKLGFEPSSTNLQTNLGSDGVRRPSGTSNRLVRLRRGFLEFLAATHDTPLADQLCASLARYEGLHLIALSSADLARQRERLIAGGFDMLPLVNLRREVQEYGVSGEVAWSVLRTSPGVMPEGRIQYVYPHTPELSWPEGSYDHPNAADSLTGVLVCHDDPTEALQRFGSYMGRAAIGSTVRTERGLLRIVDQMQIQSVIPDCAVPPGPYIAAVSIESSDMDVTRRVLAESATPTLSDGEARLWLSREYALGSYMCIHAAGHCPF